jgi:hypothetical protein
MPLPQLHTWNVFSIDVFSTWNVFSIDVFSIALYSRALCARLYVLAPYIYIYKEHTIYIYKEHTIYIYKEHTVCVC